MNQAYRINTWTPVHLMSHFSSTATRKQPFNEHPPKDAFE